MPCPKAKAEKGPLEGPRKRRLLEEECDRTVALVGAPNTGKSTLFSVLTRRIAAIANWPGVTVDVEVGRFDFSGKRICIVDLPGTYGLAPTSPEEAVTRRVLSGEKPDLIVVVLDLSQPEASLGLLIQVLEAFPGRVLVAATKAQLAHSMGIHVDTSLLSRLLHVRIVVTSALEGIGILELKEEIASYPGGGRVRVDYGVLEPIVGELEDMPETREASERLGYSRRFIAVQLVYGDEFLYKELEEAGFQSLADLGRRQSEEVKRRFGLDPEILVTEARVRFIERLSKQAVVRRKPAGTGWQRFADLFMHPLLGPVLSLLGLLVTFFLVFAVNTGFPLNLILSKLGYTHAASLLREYSIAGLLDRVFTWLSTLVKDSVGGQLGSLLGDGVIGGVGFVLSFIPLIAMIYASIAVLEDSGLAARMAVSLHPLFKKIGLSGKSVFPIVMGFGCNVPAVLSTRGLPEDERFRAVFAIPFIPCQARLVVITAFTTTLIHGVLAQTLSITVVYLEAFIAAALTSLLASRVVQPRIYRRLGIAEYEAEPELLMEIPHLHRPHWRVVWWIVRDNTIHFLRKAGTIVFMLAVITWFLLSYGPHGYTSNIEETFGAIIGDYAGRITHLFQVPPGPDRILGVGLVDGLIAKEGVLTAIAVSLGAGEQSVQEAIAQLHLTPAQSLAYLVLITLYFPCIATLAAMQTIVKSKKLVLAYALYSIVLAIAFATATYWVLRLLGLGVG